VSIFPDDAGDAATLMAHADKAMYAAKRAGKNAFCIFSGGTSGAANSIPSSGHQAA
jgi:predicted signal transduction protein with EAL and GGDEF domain